MGADVGRGAGVFAAEIGQRLFAIQVVLNSLWSILFFGLRSPGAAFIELIVLWMAILATTVAFWRRSKPAGGLLVPYLAWVSFAGLLNFAIWRLNTV